MNRCGEWRTALSVGLNGENNDYLLKAVSDAGIKTVELSTNYDTYYSKLDFVNNYDKIKADAEKYGIELWSIHLPFSGELDISLLNEKSEFTVKTNLELMEAAAKAGFKIAVVHPSSEPIADEARPSRLEKSKANLKKLAEAAKSFGMKLAVENLPRTCLGNYGDDMVYLLKDNPDLYAVFDTNHSLKQDNAEFIRAIGDRIVTLHVSDYDFIDERHLLPFKGKNNWKTIITALDEAGYNGPWLYEIRMDEGMTFADVKNNHGDLARL